MRHISFPQMLSCTDIDIEEIRRILNSFRDKTYIPLIKFPVGNEEETIRTRDAFLNHLNNLIGRIVVTEQNTLIRNALFYLVDELLSNIIHHAYEDFGYILAQNFSTKGYFDVCIADIGRTLLESYQNFENNRYEIYTHSEAMRAALAGKSTKGEMDRGFGISTSTRMLCEGMKAVQYYFHSSFHLN